ncbi:hypothetical protein MMC17_006079 [Xylographa soralifera]|nr:hypothetical protein [Xylographa soralifera]
MPAKPQVKYAPMTSKQAKAAYKKSGPAGPPEWQAKAWARQNLLLERAQKIKDQQEQAKVNKQKRDKKRAKEMAERLKRGLPVIEEGYISPRQTRMHAFLPQNGAIGEDVDMGVAVDETEAEIKDEDKYAGNDLNIEVLLDTDKRLGQYMTEIPPLDLPSLYEDCRLAKRRSPALRDSGPEVFFDENKWPPTQSGPHLDSASKSFKIQSAAIIHHAEAKALSGSYVKMFNNQQDHEGAELTSKRVTQHLQDAARHMANNCQLRNTTRSGQPAKSHSAKPLTSRDSLTSDNDVVEALIAELYAEDIDFSDEEVLDGISTEDTLEIKTERNDNLLDIKNLSRIVRVSNDIDKPQKIDIDKTAEFLEQVRANEEFGEASLRDHQCGDKIAEGGQVVEGEQFVKRATTSKEIVSDEMKLDRDEEFGTFEEEDSLMPQIFLEKLKPGQMNTTKDTSRLRQPQQITSSPIIALIHKHPQTQHLVHQKLTTIQRQNAGSGGRPLTTVQQLQLPRHTSYSRIDTIYDQYSIPTLRGACIQMQPQPQSPLKPMSPCPSRYDSPESMQSRLASAIKSAGVIIPEPKFSAVNGPHMEPPDKQFLTVSSNQKAYPISRARSGLEKASIAQEKENFSLEFDDPQWSTEDWGKLLETTESDLPSNMIA